MTNLQSKPVEHPATRSRPFDPFDGLGALREERPLARMRYPDGQIGWLVTSHALAREVLTDSRFRFQVGPTQVSSNDEPSPTPVPAGAFAVMDPPEHTYYRRKLTSAFTPRRVRPLEQPIADVVAAQLDAMRHRGGPLDLVESFTAPVALGVLSRLLGIRMTDAESLRQAQRTILTTDVEGSAPVWQWMCDRIQEHLDTKRTEPGPDLLSALLADDDLSEQEIAAISAILINGGDDSIANMLALAIFALLRHPAELERLRADPTLIENAVEELLRYVTINQYGTSRIASQDIELHGEIIRSGEVVTVSLAAANRDPAQFPDPDRLDIGREPGNHLSFGHGIHHCLAAQLARMELRIALQHLFREFPTLRLAGPPEEVPLRNDGISHGVHRLSVDWDDHH